MGSHRFRPELNSIPPCLASFLSEFTVALGGNSTKDYVEYYQLACESKSSEFLASFPRVDSCSRFLTFDGSRAFSGVYKCYQFKGILSFVWINFAWTLVCFAACIVFGLVTKSKLKGNESVHLDCFSLSLPLAASVSIRSETHSNIFECNQQVVWKAPLIELMASPPTGAVRMDSRVSDV